MYSDKLDLFFPKTVKLFLSNFYVMHSSLYFLLMSAQSLSCVQLFVTP